VPRERDENEDLLRAALAGVRPLHDRDRAPPEIAPARPQQKESARFEVDEDLSRGRAPGVNRETVSRLAGAEPPPEATLDLHGHTHDAARTRLERYLDDSLAQRRRCVLVVTGKSTRGTGATLQSEVPGWLAGPLASRVLAFARARAEHGGEGALYVLLRGRS
jgi:DNA-nicking Smr family endonuclease